MAAVRVRAGEVWAYYYRREAVWGTEEVPEPGWDLATFRCYATADIATVYIGIGEGAEAHRTLFRVSIPKEADARG